MRWHPKWCIKIPHKGGDDIRQRGDHTNHKWDWSWRTQLGTEIKPDDLDTESVRKSDWMNNDDFNCSHVLNHSTEAGNPTETWNIPKLRSFIRHMCTCWGYLNLGF